MLHVSPFAAVRPAPGREEQVASVPYDVVDTAEARELAKDNPHSFLHIVRSEIDLPDDVSPYDDRVYEAAGRAFTRLLDDGIFMREATPAIYLYRQVWQGHAQIGVVGCCDIDDYENDVIRKHEKTRKVKEDDRTRHVLSVNANTGPVFLTYRDQAEIDELVRSEIDADPLYDFTAPDGVQHTIWRVKNPAAFVHAFASVDVAYVADGHHRSASAWRAGRERRDANDSHTGREEYNRFLSVLFPATQLKILSYNRVVRDLNGLSPDAFVERLAAIGTLAPTDQPSPDAPAAFGIFVGDAWYRLTLDPATIDHDDPIASLDVALLQDRVLEPLLGIGDPRTDERIDFIGGIRGTGYLETLVRSGRAGAAFALYPTTIEQLMAVADAGLVMPPKSTWFEPKLRSGLLVHTLD